MCDAAGRKRISAVWKLKISNSSDSDLDPFLAKSAKELGRFSRRLHLRPSATSAVENPEVPRHGSSGFFTTEEQPGTLDRMNRMGRDLQDLECWNAGIMECWDTHPVNPVCDFGCSSVAFCGSCF
jgi:hypothetical protein